MADGSSSHVLHFFMQIFCRHIFKKSFAVPGTKKVYPCLALTEYAADNKGGVSLSTNQRICLHFHSLPKQARKYSRPLGLWDTSLLALLFSNQKIMIEHIKI